MMAANYRHIGGLENRLGRHYSRFSASWPAAPLVAQSLAGENRQTMGRIGEVRLEPTKTKLVEFGRFAQKHAGKRGRNRPETIYFLGLTLYCTRNRKGNVKVGLRAEKARPRRRLTSPQ